MGRQPQHREALLAAAALRFRDSGYAATGVADILRESGAPRGSLYHYFPGGKEALGAAAIRRAGTVVTRTLEEIAARAESAEEFVQRYFALLSQWLEQSGYRGGCPIATTLLETASHSTLIREAGAAVLEEWQAIIAGELGGSVELASLTVSIVEGALLQARVLRSLRPMKAAEAGLLRLL